jgi:hypothetical protein
MNLLAPDLLEITRQLSPTVCGVAMALGLGLWLFGGASHRFWLAMTLTVAAGIAGMSLARDFAVEPLVGGLLLALSAGALALALARISVFLAGGLAALLVTRMIVPGVNELITFLIGGLIGVAFYQLWITALSSLFGTVLLLYGTVSLLDQLGELKSIDWATRNGKLVNWGVIGGTLLGILIQFALDRRRHKKAADAKKVEKKKEEKPAAPPPPPPPAPPPAPPPKLPWWQQSLFRKTAM